MNLRNIAIFMLTLFLSSQLVFAADNENNKAKTQHNAALLGWLIVLNNNEINVSKLVLKRKSLNPAVKNYAKFLVEQHSKLLHETLRVSHRLHITPVQEDNAIKMKEDGDNLAKTLEAANDNEIQQTFINDMIKGHEGAITDLDQDLGNKDNLSAVQKLLKNTKAHVVIHLERAKAIKKKLGY